MIRISGTEGPIYFREYDHATAQVKPDRHIPGATAYEAAQPAGQFFYETYAQKHYTIFKSILKPSRDLLLHVEYLTPFVGFRLMVKGHLHYQLNEKKYYLMQGQLNFVTAPKVESILHLIKGQDYHMFDLQVDPAFMDRVERKSEAILQLLNKASGEETAALHNGPGFASAKVLDAMDELVKDPGNEALAIELIAQVIDARTMKRLHRPITEPQVESLFKVKALIKEQIAIKQHLRDWARAAGMNFTYFKELFKVVFAVTPYHYLLYERIREAKRMIRYYPHLTLAEIAIACGFANYNNLRRNFLTIERMTLTRWLKLSDISTVLFMLEFFA